MAIFQASWVHVYLSYPFILGVEFARGYGMWLLHCWQ